MIVIRDAQESSQPRRRWSRLIVPLGAVGLFIVGTLVGAYVMQDTAARERIQLTLAKAQHVGRYTRAMLADATLPELRIEMKDVQRLQIKNARDQAMASGILFSDEQPWVNATVGVDGLGVPVQMRLKGLFNDHRNTDKWSYRIDMPSDHAYAGMSTFSIQHPGTRNYLHEWVYLESMRLEGLLAPRYDFSNVVFNGANTGVFAIEEHVTDAWLTSQGRRDGVIVRMDDTDIWRQYLALGQHFGGVYPVGFANAPAEEYHGKRTRRDPALREQRDAAIRLLVRFTTGERKASQVFDVEQTSRFLAMHELWSSDHALGPPNARFYFNAMTGRFEPIAGDAESDFNRAAQFVSLPIYQHDRRDVGLSVFWAPRYLEDPVAMEAFVRELRRLLEPEYVDGLESQLASRASTYLAALRREYPQVEPPWAGLRRRQAQLRAMLKPSRTVLAYGQLREGRLQVQVGNVLGLPVEVLAIRFEDQPSVVPRVALEANDAVALTMADRNSVVLPLKRFDERMRYARFAADVPASVWRASEAGEQPAVRVRTRILGNEREVWVDVKMGDALLLEEDAAPVWPTMTEALGRHPFLEQAGERVLRIRAGTWDVPEDLVLPTGTALLAEPGTTLRFGANAAMVVNGPVLFEGEADAPIVLEPTGETWPGLAVLQAKGESTLANVMVRGTRGIDRHGWRLTGGVTFYESPVALRESRIATSSAASAVNMVRTRFDVRLSEFVGCAFNGLAADYSTGSIASTLFANVKGDGVAVSGGEVRIDQVTANRIGDEAIAIGEDSRAEITRTTVMAARFGIVCRDTSFIEAHRVQIRDSEVGLAAYVRKPVFGPAAINAHQTELSNVRQPTLVQTESWIKLNAHSIPGVDLDVKALDNAP